MGLPSGSTMAGSNDFGKNPNFLTFAQMQSSLWGFSRQTGSSKSNSVLWAEAGGGEASMAKPATTKRIRKIRLKRNI